MLKVYAFFLIQTSSIEEIRDQRLEIGGKEIGISGDWGQEIREAGNQGVRKLGT
jgi:hypothetical protein